MVIDVMPEDAGSARADAAASPTLGSLVRTIHEEVDAGLVNGPG
jgi:hypothetical protein